MRHSERKKMSIRTELLGGSAPVGVWPGFMRCVSLLPQAATWQAPDGVLPVVENLNWYNDLPENMPNDVCEAIPQLYKLLAVASTTEDIRSIFNNARAIFKTYGIARLILDMPHPTDARSAAFAAVAKEGLEPAIEFFPWEESMAA